DPALAAAAGVLGANGLPRQVVPFRLQFRSDVEKIGIVSPPASGEVVFLHPEEQSGRNLHVWVSEGDDVRMKIAVQEVPSIFNLCCFTFFGQSRRVLMAD